MALEPAGSGLNRKSSGPADDAPEPPRPITVLSPWYWARASIRFRHLSPWFTAWAAPELRGGLPGAECKEPSLDLALDIAAAVLSYRAPFGASIDEHSCFNSQVKPILFAEARALGAPEGLVPAQERFYQGFMRAYRYGRSVGTRWTALRGIAQGCALSIV